MKPDAKIKLDVQKLLGWQVSARPGAVAGAKVGTSKAGGTKVGKVRV